MPQAELAKPLTVASWTARSANAIGKDVARALREARKGPVHLSVPNDVLDAMAGLEDSSVEKPEARTRKAHAALAKAKRPLVIAGPAAMRRMPKGKFPVIGMESPRGLNDPSLGKLAEILAKADVVLLLGKRIDFTLRFGKIFPKSCRVLRAYGDVELPDPTASAESLVRRSARGDRLPAIGVERHPGLAPPGGRLPRGAEAADGARCGARRRRRRVRPVGAGLPARRRGA